eukprot:235884_1
MSLIAEEQRPILGEDNPEKKIFVNRGICCGCCDIFVAVYFMAALNIFMSLPFFIFGSIGASGYAMPNDNDKKTFQILFGLLIIPGIIRAVIGIIGFWLSPKLGWLLEHDEPNKRPDDYNDFEREINIWNWFVTWTPMICDPLLAAGFIYYLVDISTADDEIWKYTSNGVLTWTVSWLTGAICIMPTIDIAFSFYFYCVFKEFVEKRFKNLLFACACCTYCGTDDDEEEFFPPGLICRPIKCCGITYFKKDSICCGHKFEQDGIKCKDGCRWICNIKKNDEFSYCHCPWC